MRLKGFSQIFSFRLCLFVMLLMLSSAGAMAQGGITLKGTVVDEFGEPLIGAKVAEVGVANGAITDLDGNQTTMMKNMFGTILSLMMLSCVQTSCTQESPVTTPTQQQQEVKAVEPGTFARGVDVSWLTQMESEGMTFMNKAGVPTECMKLLKEDCNVDAIRLRVWVNPAQGWSSANDVLVKARRAAALGLRVMTDFHFSDTWADPAHQQMPAAHVCSTTCRQTAASTI